MLKPVFEKYPKAKPLALALIAAAAEQGANAKELKIACDVAINSYEEARDNSGESLALFESKATRSTMSI